MKRILLPLTVLLCVSCGTQHRNFPDFDRYPITDDASSAYVNRSGDNYNAKDSQSYDSVFREAEIQPVAERLNGGEAVFLYFYSEDCSTCKRVREAVVTFVKESAIEVFGVDFTVPSQGFAFLSDLGNAFPKCASLYGEVQTPTAFLIRKDKDPLPMSFVSFAGNADELGKYFTELMNLTGIVTFQEESKLKVFLVGRDALVYCSSRNDGYFYDNINPLAMHSKRFTARYEYGKPFPERNEDLYLVQNGEITKAVDTKKAPEEALSLINSYYA